MINVEPPALEATLVITDDRAFTVGQLWQDLEIHTHWRKGCPGQLVRLGHPLLFPYHLSSSLHPLGHLDCPPLCSLVISQPDSVFLLNRLDPLPERSEERRVGKECRP